MNQYHKVGQAQNPYDSTNVHPIGRTRMGNFNALSASAWGSQMPIGRIAIYSPSYNLKIAADEDNPDRSVCLPDATGEYLKNPVSGNMLDHADESALLAAMKVGGDYLVAGIVMEGQRCDVSECWKDQPHPVGNLSALIAKNYAQDGRAVTFQTHGYHRVQIGEDLAINDKLAFVDEPDDADPALGTYGLGAFVKAGNGVQDCPDHWRVITGGKAGESAEIFLG